MDDKYTDYELEKKKLGELTPEEYQAAIKALAERLGL